MPISKDRLSIARQEANMSQYDLAEEISKKIGDSFAKSNISLWERGRRDIPMKYLDILSDILKVDKDYLLGENVTKDGVAYSSHIDAKVGQEEIPYSELFMYDGLPLFVEFINGDRENAWAIYDRMNGLLHFMNQKIKVNLNLSRMARFYLNADVYVQYSSLYRNSLNMTQFMKAKNVFVRSISADPAIKNRIDGWYHHSTDKTYLLDGKGNTLEYSNLGVTYMAYSEGYDSEKYNS